jgi:hypothetical protein
MLLITVLSNKTYLDHHLSTSKAFLEHVMKHAFRCSFENMYEAFLKHILITNKAHLKHF